MTSFRFMSWNWNCFSDGRNNRKIDLIRQMQAQVVALQEVDTPAYELLRKEFNRWLVVMPGVWDVPGASIDEKGHRLPSTALLIHPDLRGEKVRDPDMGSWSSTESRAGLGFHPDQEHDETIPQPRSMVGATIDVGGTQLLVVSAHAPHAAGEGDERVRRILRKRRTYEVLRRFVGDGGPVVLGMDANAWIDPEPDEKEVFGRALEPLEARQRPDPSIDQSDIGQFLDNGFVNGEYEPDEPRDALRIWLEADEGRRQEVLARRPYGPWAVTYNRSANYARPDRRDLVMVSSGIEVANVEHNYEDSLAAGSDHSYVLCDLEI